MKFNLTLKLTDTAYPFKLSDQERKMTADDWAWKFLRLNPRYRYDCELAKKQKDLFPNAWRLPSVQHLVDAMAKQRRGFKNLSEHDCRFFVSSNGVLESEHTWPSYKPETLGEHQARTQIGLNQIRFREFEANWDYGIDGWIDPALPTLPPRASKISWFHWMHEPIWESAHSNFHPFESTFSSSAELGKHVSDIKLSQAKDALPAKISRPGLAPLPPSDGTWFAFVVSAHTYLKPQLKRAKDVATLYQKAIGLDKTVQIDTRAPPPPGFEPLVWIWGRNVRHFRKIATALDTMLQTNPSRHQWLTVFLDARFDLEAQFEEIQEKVLALQGRLPGYSEWELRERAGNLKTNDFWLKEFAVIAEMLTTRAVSGCFPSAADVDRCLFEAGDPDWHGFWTDQLAQKTAPVPPPRKPTIDKVRNSASEARKMVEGDYQFLLGR